MKRFLNSLVETSPQKGKEDGKGKIVKNVETKHFTPNTQTQANHSNPFPHPMQYTQQYPTEVGGQMVMPINPNTIDTTQFDQHLEEILIENKKGIDIFELLQSVSNLTSMGVPEVQAYQSAYLTLKTMKLTKEILVNSCKKNIEIITNDQTNFNTEIQQAMQSDLSEKTTKMQDLSDQISKLEIQISNLRLELAETNTQLQQNQTELKIKQQGFDISAQKYISMYHSALQKIENYITQ